MLYDLTVSALVALIVLTPTIFAAWYDGRQPTQTEG
jgi:hypothetical protein